MEMTSSGMTHTCTTVWYGFAGRFLLRAYDAHRLWANATTTQLNFGTVEIAWPNQTGQAQPRIKLATRGTRGVELLQYTFSAGTGKGIESLHSLPLFSSLPPWLLFGALWAFAVPAALLRHRG